MQELGPVEACLGRHSADDRQWGEQGHCSRVFEHRGIRCLGFRMNGVHGTSLGPSKLSIKTV